MDKLEQVFQDTNECIVFAANDQFVPCLSVMLQSIFENQKQENKYDIIVFHKNISELNNHFLKEMVKEYNNISLRLFNVSEYLEGLSFYTANRASLSEETYFRLIIPWVLDESYKYALYLDGDMVTQCDIKDIFQYAPKECLISAVRDYWGICNCYIPGDDLRAYREGIGLTNIDDYIISATIIFNLAKFRKCFSLDEVLNIATRREWRQHDQDVINILCKDSIQIISPTWGMMEDYGNNHYLPQKLLNELNAVKQFPNIIHYGGRRKPWKEMYVHFDLIFWKYAHNTPYFSLLLNSIRSVEYKSYVAYNLSAANLDYYVGENTIQRFFEGCLLGDFASDQLRYREITIQNNVLHLEGTAFFFGVAPDCKIEVFVDINGSTYPVTTQKAENGSDMQKGIPFKYRGEYFSFDYLLDMREDNYTVRVLCRINGLFIEKRNLGFDRFCPIGTGFKNSYFTTQGWMLKTNKSALLLSRESSRARQRAEMQFCKELWKTGKKANRKAVFARFLVGLLKKFVKKPIWLISDRVSKADDNGEAFFCYLAKNHKDKIHPIFVISKNSPDYARLKKYGMVVPIYSYRHKVFHLLASFSIFAQTDEVYKNPFAENYPAYQDQLSKVKLIFLQHGIISTSLSRWLCKKDQGFCGFVMSSPNERHLVMSENYGYSEDVLWMTGLPRFDYLENHAEKCITVLPTWRKYLATGQDFRTGVWGVQSGFSQSRYVSFYRDLMNCPRLKEKASALGYKLQFKVHPSFLGHENDFEFDESVQIVDPWISYREMYAKSDLIVTDYSSSIYDFLYLRKPIIYAQFDINDFFGGTHMCEKGEFDYERDGFGEVEYDLESTVDRIIEYMENGCQLKDKYRERIDKFFAFNDRNNCQRVYEKIMELEKET